MVRNTGIGRVQPDHAPRRTQCRTSIMNVGRPMFCAVQQAVPVAPTSKQSKGILGKTYQFSFLRENMSLEFPLWFSPTLSLRPMHIIHFMHFVKLFVFSMRAQNAYPTAVISPQKARKHIVCHLDNPGGPLYTACLKVVLYLPRPVGWLYQSQERLFSSCP